MTTDDVAARISAALRRREASMRATALAYCASYTEGLLNVRDLAELLMNLDEETE